MFPFFFYLPELSSQDRDPLITARYEDGKFFYENEWYIMSK